MKTEGERGREREGEGEGGRGSVTLDECGHHCRDTLRWHACSVTRSCNVGLRRLAYIVYYTLLPYRHAI